MFTLRSALALALPILLPLAACSSGSRGSTPEGSGDDAGTEFDGGPVSMDGGSKPTTGGKDSGTGPVANVTVAAQAFDNDFAAAICTKLASCCSDADYNIFFARFHDKPYDLAMAPPRDQCATVLSATLWKVYLKWTDSANRGRMTFNAARGKTCVSDVSATTCGVPLALSLGDACLGLRGNEVFTKIAPTGSACQDIGDGTYYGECDPKQGFCGTNKVCEAWGKTGDQCQIYPVRKFCGTDLECDGETPSKPGTCTAPAITKHLGEGCAAATGPLELCESGTFCDFGTSKCVAKKADGEACGADEECKSEHPYTCFPFGSGKCGATAFCGATTK